jgi:hypothetical protein
MGYRRLGAGLLAALWGGVAGCAPRRCLVTDWLAVESREPVQVVTHLIAFGSASRTVQVRSPGGWREAERYTSGDWYRTRIAAVLILRAPSGEATAAHVYREGDPSAGSLDLAGCRDPRVLPARDSLLCWRCERGEEDACSSARLWELGLDGEEAWERPLDLPSLPEAGRPCAVRGFRGLSRLGNPVVRLSCPAPGSTGGERSLDVEPRADGFAVLAPVELPDGAETLPWVDGHCPSRPR